jgi:hypothetical protein
MASIRKSTAKNRRVMHESRKAKLKLIWKKVSDAIGHCHRNIEAEQEGYKVPKKP